MLTPWARATITLWVLVTVPMMALMLLALIAAVPRLLGTAGAAVRKDAAAVAQAWSDGAFIDVAAHTLQVLGVVLPVLACALILGRDRDPDVPGAGHVEPRVCGQAGGGGRDSAPPWSRRSPGPGGRTPATTSRSSRGRTASSPVSCISRRRSRPSRPAPWPGRRRDPQPFRAPRVGTAAQDRLSDGRAAGGDVPEGRRAADEGCPRPRPGARPHGRHRVRRPTALRRTPGSSPSTSRFRPRRVTTRPSQSPRTTDR